MGFVNMHVQSLKPKHVEKLVERWQTEGLSTGTLKNRMSTLRWWAEKSGKANVVAKSNDVYDIADRRYVTSVSKAKQLTSGDLAEVTDPYTRMSLGCRRHSAYGAKSRSRSGRGGRTAATPCSSRTVGQKAAATARSRSATSSNAKSWTRRSVLQERAV